MHQIALFASGSGSNAENIVRYFQDKPLIHVACICTNRPDAPVIKRAEGLNTSVLVFNRKEFYDLGTVAEYLRERKVEWIVLAGFLWLIPQNLLDAWPNRIMNIHPALLPKYGGKGMYGLRVHQAVIDHRDMESGITIHLIDQEYDKGSILFQKSCPVRPGDTAESLAERVHQLEYEYYPRIIEQTILGKRER